MPTGKIVVGGYTWDGATYDFAVARYNPDGTLDNSFDGDGTVTTPLSSTNGREGGLTLQPDGKILVAGSTYNGTDHDFALVRYNPGGSLDASFGTNGKLITGLGSSDEEALAIAIQPDGNIVAAGYTTFNENTGETQSGIEFRVRTNNAVEIVERVAGQAPVVLAQVPFEISAGDGFDYEIFDDGENLVFTVTRVSDGATVTVSESSTLEYAKNHVVIHNGISSKTLPTFSYLDDFRLTTGQIGHTLVLESGESASGRDFGNRALPGEAPIVDLNGPATATNITANLVENDPPVAIATVDATVTDADTQYLNSITATITNLADSGDEILSVDTNGTSLSSEFSNGRLTIRGPASIADFETALRTLTYANTSENPAIGQRVIHVVANDGRHEGAAAVATVDVTRSNDRPVIVAPDTVDAARGRFTSINVVSVNDVDLAFVHPIDVTLSVDVGNIELATLAGLTLVSGENGGASIQVRGVLPDINAALATLAYVAGDSFTGPANLTIAADDLGNFGPEGVLVAQHATTINVTTPGAASIASRQTFYNGSSFDVADPPAFTGDDQAIATDKAALLPGETASFVNYTSYAHGLNGVIVDIQNVAAPSSLSLSDFEFHVGNSDDKTTWELAPAPSLIVRPFDGEAGADRIVLTWIDGSITNQWLGVRVLATANTGLAADDVFYFGNAIGESGDSPANALVNGFDFAGVRENATSDAAIGNVYDHNRDGLVDGADLAIARDHATNFVTSLRLLTAPQLAPPMSESFVIVNRVERMVPSFKDLDRKRTFLPSVENRALMRGFAGWTSRLAADGASLGQFESRVAEVPPQFAFDLESIIDDLFGTDEYEQAAR